MVYRHVFSLLGMVSRYSSWTRVFSVGYDINKWFIDTCFLCWVWYQDIVHGHVFSLLGMISTHGLNLLGMVSRYGSWTRVFSVGYDINILFNMDTCFSVVFFVGSSISK